MELRSNGRKLSFDLLSGYSSGESEILLHRSTSDPVHHNGGGQKNPAREKKRHKRKRKNKSVKRRTSPPPDSIEEHPVISPTVSDSTGVNPVNSHAVCSDFNDKESRNHENGSLPNGLETGNYSYRVQSNICRPLASESGGSVTTVIEHVESNFSDQIARPLFAELRQRGVNGSTSDDLESRIGGPVKDETSTSQPNSTGQERQEPDGNLPVLETVQSVDWKKIMAETSDTPTSVERLPPLKYFMEELYAGNSLRSTTSIGNDKKRQRVYNTMFHVPWRCELLIDVGFFVCLDSFLSLLTIMPARILMTIWRFFNKRQFQRPSAAELSDFSCCIILAVGIASLEATDISLIYHIIRGQGTIKLYVVYNVLEIFDRLCQSFGGDVLQVLFNSAEGVASCPQENMGFELMRFLLDQTIAVAAFIVHSFILLAQAITLSTCIVAHNNALLALLISNNFAEIKSNVFKRFSKENIHSLVYADTIERFHITAFVLFVLAQNILEAEGPWFESFVTNALLVYFCEMFIDVIKHSFLAKFNEIKPVAYSEFLEHLCKQTLNIDSEDSLRNLTFVPLAPACVVIRVLTPVYAAHLPYGPVPWRLFWIFLLSAMTYIMLATLKVMVGMGLNLHATWYVNRCIKRRQHLHLD